MFKRTFLGALGAALLTLACSVQAQDSGRPIQIIVPYPAGGTADVLPRLVSQKVSGLLGQPVVVVNKPGAAGVLGADFVAHAPADGLTLLVVPPHFFVSDSLYKVKFQPRDFVPVSILAAYPNVLLVGPKWANTDLKGFVAAAKSAKEPFSAGSPGAGTSQHLSAEMLRMMAGVNYTHIPYKGSSPALTDLMGGQIDFMFDNLIAAQPLIKTGKLKLLAVGSNERSRLHPDVPALKEIAPGYESVTWMGIVAPPGTPKAVVDRLSAAFMAAVNSPEIKKQIEDMTAEPVGNSSAAMAETVRRDVARWSRVIKSANVTVE
jgi:tripartite-type tricarboxylate transporter receptor subunit TctC